MPLSDLASSAEAFLDAAGEFFGNLSAIDWAPFGLALACLAGMQLARARGWRNVLRAAYPEARISFPLLVAAYLAGAGINAVVPARAGDVTKVFLVKRQIPGSSYPAVTSSFLVQTIFDTTAGLLVMGYAVSLGLLPRPPSLPDLPAFELSFWAEHPRVFLAVVVGLLLAGAIAVYYLGHHVRRFWERVEQGVTILRTPAKYIREVASWQGIGWLFRFAAFWFFLDAFGIGGSIGKVFLVMSVQAISNVVPFTPGGAGAQQALLVATLPAPTRAAVLSFSVGTQIAMAAWSVVLGLAATALAFKTTNWRQLIRDAEQDERESRPGQAQGRQARTQGEWRGERTGSA